MDETGTSTPIPAVSPLSTPPVHASPTTRRMQLTTEPRILHFAEQEKESKKELKIVNTGGCRMAWRMLSNAPRLYLINPNKGFISDKETARVEVTLIDSSKHISRHQFVLQMKKAGDEEVDREEIWERTDEGTVSNLRVTTHLEPDPNKMRSSSSCSSLTSPSPAKSTASSESTPTLTAISPANPEDHGEFLDEIRALDVEVHKALDDKADRAKELTKAVNDVKQLEVELDKETNRLYEFSRRNATLSTEIAAVKKKRDDVQHPRGV